MGCKCQPDTGGDALVLTQSGSVVADFGLAVWTQQEVEVAVDECTPPPPSTSVSWQPPAPLRSHLNISPISIPSTSNSVASPSHLRALQLWPETFSRAEEKRALFYSGPTPKTKPRPGPAPPPTQAPPQAPTLGF